MTSCITPAEYKNELAKAMPERGRDGLQQQVMDRLKVYSFAAYHTFDSRKSEPGFPDIIAIKGSRILAIELKRENAKPSNAQVDWLQQFEEAGAECYLWRPSDLLSGRIDEVLAMPDI